MGQYGGVRVGRKREVVFGCLPHQPRQRAAECLVDGGESVPGSGKALCQVLSHSDPLRPLPRAHQYAHHLMTELPQVNPAPKATSRITDPDFTRPSVMAWSRASGIEAEEVLPYRSTLTITLSIDSPACLAVAS